MMSVMTEAAPRSAVQSAWPPNGSGGDRDAPAAPQRPTIVPPRGTGRGRGDAEQVPCGGGCGKRVPAANKSGLCRACFYTSDWPRRNAVAKRGQGQARKTDPEEQAKFLLRLVASAARRLSGEDPGVGLAPLLKAQAVMDDLVDRAGVARTRELGPQLVAEGLEAETGERWVRRRVDKRWGPSSPAAGRYPLYGPRRSDGRF